MKSIAIIGASLAGLSTARALRKAGFDGRLDIIGAESHRPYDRPPLSKGFLAGTVTETELALESEAEDLNAHWRLGVSAIGLKPSDESVLLSDGGAIRTDGMVVATGASARSPWPNVPAGVQVLRSLADAVALRERLVPGVRLAVVGAGFIGAEVAATASGLGVEVTVIEAAGAALVGPLGPQMASVVSGLHADHGVRLLCGVPVAGFTEIPGTVSGTAANGGAASGGAARGARQVSGVELADGRLIEADVVVLGVGVVPNTDWLSGCGIEAVHGVRCNAYGGTELPNVVAVGDCASWFDPQLGGYARLEHWTAARERAAIAAAWLLSGGQNRLPSRPPYFWSDQYDKTIQLAGYPHDADSVLVEEGSIADRDFLAVYRRADAPIAVLALGHGKSFMRWRRQLATAPSAAVR